MTKNNKAAQDTYLSLEEIDLDLVDDNELSVNEEDDHTFQRLRDEIKSRGMVDVPTVRPIEGGRYKVLGGRHRLAASRANGNKKEHVVVYRRAIKSKEDEFNLVNNLNAIKGTLRKGSILKVIKQQNLDPTKLDIHKMPYDLLMPVITSEDFESIQNEAQRNAKINAMSLSIAKEIAATLIDERDELLSFMVVKDKPVAVIRIPFQSSKEAREKANSLKNIIQKALEGII